MTMRNDRNRMALKSVSAMVLTAHRHRNTLTNRGNERLIITTASSLKLIFRKLSSVSDVLIAPSVDRIASADLPSIGRDSSAVSCVKISAVNTLSDPPLPMVNDRKFGRH